MVAKYIPKRKDIVYVEFDPTKGHEQKGKRPAIVLSNYDFNKNTKMVIVCPITSNNKPFPTHYLLRDTKKISGSVLCEHVRSIDFEIRKIKYIETASEKDFNEVIELFNSCVDE